MIPAAVQKSSSGMSLLERGFMLSKTFKVLDRAFSLFEDWSLFLAVTIALFAGIGNIVLRKTTDVNLYWSVEVVRKVIYFTSYIGCVAAIRSRSLIRIDVLPQLLPVTKRLLNLVSHLAVLAFAAFMLRLGWQMTVMAYQDPYAYTATLKIPEWYFYAVLPLMGAMMFLRTLIVLVEDWKEV
jgi:TRAP-type C4-dicarboxylate transport system permease small subunit